MFIFVYVVHGVTI